jgi:hypothetical protein
MRRYLLKLPVRLGGAAAALFAIACSADHADHADAVNPVSQPLAVQDQEAPYFHVFKVNASDEATEIASGTVLPAEGRMDPKPSDALPVAPPKRASKIDPGILAPTDSSDLVEVLIGVRTSARYPRLPALKPGGRNSSENAPVLAARASAMASADAQRLASQTPLKARIEELKGSVVSQLPVGKTEVPAT